VKVLLSGLRHTIYHSNASAFIKSYNSYSLDIFKDLFNSYKQNVIFAKKACHCNKIFQIKTRVILALNHFIPRCAYYNPYFAFRRTGTHPPYFA